MKKISLVLIAFIIFSCSQPGFTPDYTNPVFTLDMQNSFTEVSLELKGKYIELQNISNSIIIKLDYTVNNQNTILIEAIVPGQIVHIAAWLDNRNLSCIINEVRTH